MLTKIISGGQTGADLGALDAAIKVGLPHGGWIPKGRKTEDGILPKRYRLREMPTSSYPERTEQNVIKSDGTLIISHGALTGGSEYTRLMCTKHNKPCHHIDLNQTAAFSAANQTKEWILDKKIHVLNVAGPRASKDPNIYKSTFDIIETVFYLSLMDSKPEGTSSASNQQPAMIKLPQTVDEAVDMLIPKLSLKDKATIANMTESELVTLRSTLGQYIRNSFGLWDANDDLIASVEEVLKETGMTADSVTNVILNELWKKLQKSHKLRIIK